MGTALQGVPQSGAPPLAHPKPLHTRSPCRLPRRSSLPTPQRHLRCLPQASLTRVLEEALPLFIARKQAFHLLLNQVWVHPTPTLPPNPDPDPDPNAGGPSYCHLTSSTGVRWARSSRPSCCGGRSRRPCRASLARRRGSSSTPPHSAAATRCSMWPPSPYAASSSAPRYFSRCAAKPHTSTCSAGLCRSRLRPPPGRWAVSSRAVPLARTTPLVLSSALPAGGPQGG